MAWVTVVTPSLPKNIISGRIVPKKVALKGAASPRAYLHGNFLAENSTDLDARVWFCFLSCSRHGCCREVLCFQRRLLTFSTPASGKLVARKAFIFSREL
jgi:hypothetical protein